MSVSAGLALAPSVVVAVEVAELPLAHIEAATVVDDREAVLEVAHVSNDVAPADRDLVRVTVAGSAVTLHVIVSAHAVRVKREMAMANVKRIVRRRILANDLKHLDPPRVLDHTRKKGQCPVEDQRIL